MGPRMNKMSRWRLGISGCALFLVFSLMYFYQGSRDYVQTIKLSEKRCLSEQESLTYQLKVVTEYKGKLEKMLNEIQDSQNSDKEKYKEIAERCVTMKQQSVLCQSQFDDLQVECKKVRDNVNKEKVESAKFKEKYLHEQNTNHLLKQNLENKQINIDEVFVELKTLRAENQVLRLNLQRYEENDRQVVGNNRAIYGPQVHLGNNKYFSKETEVDDGLYIIRQTNLHAGGADQGKPIVKKSHSMFKEKKNLEKKTLDKASKLLPPGVPPVLSVENEEPMKKVPPQLVKYNEMKLKHQGDENQIVPNDPIIHQEVLDVVAPPPDTNLKRDSLKYEEGIAVVPQPGDGILQEDPAGEAEVDDGMMQDEDDEDEDTGVEQ